MVPTAHRRKGLTSFRGCSRPRHLTASFRHLSLSCKNQDAHRPLFLVTGFLAFLSACLLVGLLTYIVIEAFDGDSDLWPIGAEDFDASLPGPFSTASQFIGGVSALSVILCTLVMTAGACLVLRHRARSALAADTPSVYPSCFHMAESCGRT